MSKNMNGSADIDYAGILDDTASRAGLCRARTEVMSRVVGFYAGVHAMNRGKQAEFRSRKMFNLKNVTEGK